MTNTQTVKTNIWGLKVGDRISFTNKVDCFMEITVTRVEEKSWYGTKGGRNSWNTLAGYAKYPDFRITRG